MTILDHEHVMNRFEGRLLSPDEKANLSLQKESHYFITGRCTLNGCSYFTYEEIPAETPKPRARRRQHRR